MEEDKQQDCGPERFDPVLLTQPKAERLAWFEKECTLEHTNLLQVSTPTYNWVFQLFGEAARKRHPFLSCA